MTREWYSLKPLESRGAKVSFSIARRSAGKTFSFKERAFRKYQATGKLWAYVRRDGDEIAIAKRTLWNDFIFKQGYEVKARGIECFIRPLFKEEIYEDVDGKTVKTKPEPWKIFGYFLCISDAQDYKGASFPEVEALCFDEFIIENKRRQYIPDEVNQFMGILSSVFRDRPIKAFCFSNAGFISNPYFREYGIVSEDFYNTRFVKRNGGNVIFEFFTPTQTDEQVSQEDIALVSPSSRFIDYALKSKFMDAVNDLVDPKPIGARPFVKFTDDGEIWFTLYHSKHQDTYWVDRVDSRAQGFALRPSLVSSDTYYSADAVSNAKRMVDERRMSFATVDVRAVFLGLLKRS